MHFISDSQKKTLLKNPNIHNITEKQCVFTAAFRIKAIELFIKGVDSNEIFRSYGIDPNLFAENYPRLCIKIWRKKYETQGKASLKESIKGLKPGGRRPKIDKDSLSVDDLKSIIAVQEELIEQLKKRKALARKT